MAVITSRSNATVKSIRALRNRKERTETGLLFAEGTHAVGMAVEAGWEIVQLVATPERIRSPYALELIESIVARGRPCLEVTEDVYESLTENQGRQGVSAVIRQRWTPLEQVQPTGDRIWVAMNSVQYPGNLGTIMRTLDSVGGAGLILLGNSTDPFDPLAVRSSMGAAFCLQFVRTEMDELAAWKRRWNVNLVAADVAGTVSYREAVYRSPAVLLMGAESSGLTQEQRELCDTLVRIPMVGRSDSLNVAVAAGVILYEIFHQMRA